MRLRWSRRAQRQLEREIVYLEEQRSGAGRRLHAAIGEAADLVQRQPRACPRVPGLDDGNVRRALVWGFKYWLIFELSDDGRQAVVLALWSTRMRPMDWMGSR